MKKSPIRSQTKITPQVSTFQEHLGKTSLRKIDQSKRSCSMDPESEKSPLKQKQKILLRPLEEEEEERISTNSSNSQADELV